MNAKPSMICICKNQYQNKNNVSHTSPNRRNDNGNRNQFKFFFSLTQAILYTNSSNHGDGDSNLGAETWIQNFLIKEAKKAYLWWDIKHLGKQRLAHLQFLHNHSFHTKTNIKSPYLHINHETKITKHTKPICNRAQKITFRGGNKKSKTWTKHQRSNLFLAYLPIPLLNYKRRKDRKRELHKIGRPLQKVAIYSSSLALWGWECAFGFWWRVGCLFLAGKRGSRGGGEREFKREEKWRVLTVFFWKNDWVTWLWFWV